MGRDERRPGGRLAASLLVLLLTGGPVVAADSTFYVVRHANRPPDPSADTDPPLTLVGMRRAEELRDVLRDVRLSAVYATRTLRAWQTAMPSATAAGVEITAYPGPPSPPPPPWIAGLIARHDGQSVLIVSHSGDVEKIVEGLGGKVDRRIGEEFDNLFVVRRTAAGVQTEHRKYPVLEPLGKVTLRGVQEPSDLSGIAAAKTDGVLVVVSDEGAAVQVLKGGPTEYKALAPIELGKNDDKEFDLEGITRHGDGRAYYVVGSHGLVRKSIFRDKDDGSTLKKIRERFEDESPERQESREHLIRLEIDDSGQLVAGSRKDASLRDVIDNQVVLKRFGPIASKENGVDIEGIASDGERLYLGLRGPVLRFGFAIVLVLRPEPVRDVELRYLQMDGRGIRDIARVKGGFLVIAGPVGDSSVPCQLYHWDGGDGLPGKRTAADPPSGRVTLLGTIPSSPGAEPEGLVVLKDNGADPRYEVLVVYDGVDGGNPTRFKVPRPAAGPP